MSRAARLRDWIVSSLSGGWIDPRDVRAETWALAGRHRGHVLEGARIELKARDLPRPRRRLLRAVVRSQGGASRKTP